MFQSYLEIPQVPSNILDLPGMSSLQSLQLILGPRRQDNLVGFLDEVLGDGQTDASAGSGHDNHLGHVVCYGLLWERCTVEFGGCS